jgi:hypothetical protein
MSFINVQYGYN